jgi:hypothetical protein
MYALPVLVEEFVRYTRFLIEEDHGAKVELSIWSSTCVRNAKFGEDVLVDEVVGAREWNSCVHDFGIGFCEGDEVGIATDWVVMVVGKYWNLGRGRGVIVNLDSWQRKVAGGCRLYKQPEIALVNIEHS